MRVGMFAVVENDPESVIAKVHELGFPVCEVYTNNLDLDSADRLRRALDRYGVEASAVSSLGPGRMVWDFYQGPLTIGIVPREWRRKRIDHFKRASDFAKRAAIPAFDTHCGFIPENPNDPLYKETVEALHEVVSYCRSNGQTFLYHAGQETPVTLLRAIQDVGLDNQGVCLDTANPIMYDTGHPVDALDVYGQYLRAVNPKDGLYPTNPKDLGKEVPIGQGKVGFPRFIQRLKELGYRGPLNIEREISGPEQIADIKKAKVFLEQLLG
jgi:sugar phosphate isomerase/epimerase